MSIFTDIRIRKPKRTKKNMSFTSIVTSRFGSLTPILCKEVYPNETWKETPQVLCRMTPLIVPLMSKMEIRVDYFFVPNRILWTEWEEFITRGLDGLQEITKPTVTLDNLHPYHGSLTDYLNIATIPYADRENMPVSFSSIPVDVLPYAAYRYIWQEWYADENLQSNDFVTFPMTTNEMVGAFDDRSITPESYARFHQLMSRGWKKDYFTSALPWAQRGPEVTMNTDIYGNGGKIGNLAKNYTNTSGASSIYDSYQNNKDPYDSDVQSHLSSFGDTNTHDMLIKQGQSDLTSGQIRSEQSKYLAHFHALGSTEVDSTDGKVEGLEGEGFTVNEFRRLVALQEWFETNARAGGRYVESLLAHFGIRVADYRLDRPEYIGGVTNDFTFGEVLQTSSNDSATGQALGAYAGRGVSLCAGKIKKYRVPEHGWLMGIMSIRPKRNAYYQGVPRQFSRFAALDYMFPRFANLGEQAIKEKEIYAFDADHLEDDYGYTPRFADLYQSMDELHGEMRNTLDYWHTARKFSSYPTLSSQMVDLSQAANQLNRIFAYDSTSGDYNPDDSANDHFILEIHQSIKAKRCLPVSPIPHL